MKRKQRTKILVGASSEFLQKCAQKIRNTYEVKMIEEPSNSLVMVKMRESAKNTLFYLGEVVVSECKVEVEGKIGLGIIQEIELKKAEYLALIDGAYNAELDIVEELNQCLLKEEKRQEEKALLEKQAILKTKVNFETMDQ